MIHLRALGAGAVLLLLAAHGVQAQDHSQYRDFKLGSSLSSVATRSGMAATEAKTLHERPALVQELEWRPRFVLGTTTTKSDPIRTIDFNFYNDQLFRVVVEYDPLKTEGLTDADMADAISVLYGPSSKPVKRVGAAAAQAEQDWGASVAEWRDEESSVVLYHSSYASGFRLVVASRKVEGLARTADTEARRLDEREAPQREIARQKKETEDARAAADQKRVTNKAAFAP